MATLKISDLSVGDWVEFRGNNCTICSIYQASIYSPDEVALLSDNNFLGVAPVSELRPIPITAEILEKNGWIIPGKEALGEDYEYEGEKRVWYDENCSIDICEAKQGVFWYSYSGEYYMWRLEYVHQLQHLIRLAGLDKEINL